MNLNIDKKQNCPCGSGRNVEICCNKIINGETNAVTAEELMRSRYVAFTQANIDYLMRSHHSTTRPNKEKRNIEKWAKSVKWIGLTILNTQAGQSSDELGYVEFVAVYIENGRLEQIHETSLFKRENKLWVYVSGTFN